MRKYQKNEMLTLCNPAGWLRQYTQTVGAHAKKDNGHIDNDKQQKTYRDTKILMT